MTAFSWVGPPSTHTGLPYLFGEPHKAGGEVAEGASAGLAEGPGCDAEELPGHPTTVTLLTHKRHLQGPRYHR